MVENIMELSMVYLKNGNPIVKHNINPLMSLEQKVPAAQTAKLVIRKNRTEDQIEFNRTFFGLAVFMKNPKTTIKEKDKYTAHIIEWNPIMKSEINIQEIGIISANFLLEK